ncbi:hypothetical protein ACA910_014595 [Epithemia clementina (nom. ined.)]
MIDYQEDPTTAFFELANAPCIRYRLPSEDSKISSNNDHSGNNRGTIEVPKDRKKRARAENPENALSGYLVVGQNSQAQTHTGGVVWETSYLLLEYLLHLSRVEHNRDINQIEKGFVTESPVVGPNVLEVGAGCGLLGMALAAGLPHLRKVVLTETKEVWETILQPNLHRNHHIFDVSSKDSSVSSLTRPKVSSCALDWTRFHEDAQKCPELFMSALSPSEQQCFDTIVGTDVIFSPTLVEPLLATLRFLAHDTRTKVYLCLQPDRCPKSYKLLQDKAPEYGFVWSTISLVDQEMYGLSDGNTKVEQARDVTSATTATTTPLFLQWAKSLESKIIFLHRRLPELGNAWSLP